MDAPPGYKPSPNYTGSRTRNQTYQTQNTKASSGEQEKQKQSSGSQDKTNNQKQSKDSQGKAENKKLSTNSTNSSQDPKRTSQQSSADSSNNSDGRQSMENANQLQAQPNPQASQNQTAPIQYYQQQQAYQPYQPQYVIQPQPQMYTTPSQQAYQVAYQSTGGRIHYICNPCCCVGTCNLRNNFGGIAAFLFVFTVYSIIHIILPPSKSKDVYRSNECNNQTFMEKYDYAPGFCEKYDEIRLCCFVLAIVMAIFSLVAAVLVLVAMCCRVAVTAIVAAFCIGVATLCDTILRILIMIIKLVYPHVTFFFWDADGKKSSHEETAGTIVLGLTVIALVVTLLVYLMVCCVQLYKQIRLGVDNDPASWACCAPSPPQQIPMQPAPNPSATPSQVGPSPNYQ